MKHKSIFDYIDQEFLRAYRKRNAELYMKKGLCVLVLKQTKNTRLKKPPRKRWVIYTIKLNYKPFFEQVKQTTD